jgi:hypothetical protein
MADPTINALHSLEKSLLEMRGMIREVITGVNPLYSQIVARVSSKPSDSSLKATIYPLTNPVQAKIADLRNQSSSSSPQCFKCDETRHFASAYRNATLCL